MRRDEQNGSSARPQPCLRQGDGDTVAEVVVNAVVPRLASKKAKVNALPNIGLGALHRDGSAHFGMATIDDHGRIAERQLLRALSWTHKQRLDIVLHDHAILVQANPEGASTLTSKGLLQIPARIRRWCALSPGDRLLLVALPEHDLLILHGPSTLDTMLVNFYTGTDHGNGSPKTRAG